MLARWRERSADGCITWHLAGLRADHGFWGYVHFRTTSRNENRSFEGTFDADTFERIANLIRNIEKYSPDNTETKVLDGLIGIGQRSSFRRIFGVRNGVCEPDHPSAVDGYEKLLGLIQPILAASIIQ